MTFSVAKLLVSMTLLCVSHAALAAAGTPIGGIIVKGGKNPGGQMHVLTTTDPMGTFKVAFAEGGDYTLEFEGRSSKAFGERVKAGMQLDYVMRARDEVGDANTGTANANRHTPFHNKVQDARIVVTVPNGGGEISGVLQALDAAQVAPVSGRSINESGVSVKSSKPKGGIKH